MAFVDSRGEAERRAAILDRLNEGEHRRLFTIVPLHPQDYEPYGVNVRWADDNLAYPDCSCGCRWARWLEDLHEDRDRLSMDWLVCTNPKSYRCGWLTFEHQGCQHFEPDEKEEGAEGS